MKNKNLDSEKRVLSIKGFLHDSKSLLKDVENLTSNIYNDNISNLKSFKDVLAVVDQKLISNIPNKGTVGNSKNSGID